MIRSLLATGALALLAGCALVDPPAPSQFASEAALTGAPEVAAYEARFSSLIAGFDRQRLRNLAGLRAGDRTEPQWLTPTLAPIEARAAALDTPHLDPVPGLAAGMHEWAGRWRSAVTALILTDGASVQGVPFRLPDQNELERIVTFRSIARTDGQITAECDGPVQFEQGGRTWSHSADPFTFAVAAGERDKTLLTLPPQTESCHLQIAFPGQAVRVLDLVGERAADPEIAALDQRFDVCLQPDPSRLDALQATFFAERWMSQTCAMDAGEPVLLPRSSDGYNAKIEALTGKRLTEAELDAGDPTVPLDFSNAPQLDMIWLSYLDLKADFSGAILVHALRWHAERGTLIRILVSNVLEHPKDLALWEQLAAEFPNVQFQLFSWNPPAHGSQRAYLDGYHRVNHVKLFITLASDPARSRAILGGRNIHDGFLFDQSLDLSPWPELQQYGEPGEFSLKYFSTYHDFEVEITAPDAVRTLAAHLATLWHRDGITTVTRPFSLGTTGPGSETAPLTGARHFISVPYLDHHALEHYWVDLIDSAQQSIQIATPYLNPTPSIEAALERALARGIDVTIVARVALYGDLGGRLMTEMNTLFVERYAERMTMYEYNLSDVVLHSKILLIDGRLSVVSSVNMNRRSFLHDTENGIVILDPAFARRMQSEIDTYIAQSYRLEPDSFSVRPWVRHLFSLQWIRNLV